MRNLPRVVSANKKVPQSQKHGQVRFKRAQRRAVASNLARKSTTNPGD